MDNTQLSYEAASAQLDYAMSRLETAVRDLAGRQRAHARTEADAQKLIADRARFAVDLDKASARARRLDDASGEVARRLVVAMDVVNEVLAR
ncbi:MAG: DUF4164 family protein [Devosia sp.]